MNTLQLEQLISGYLDNELSPNRKLEVENLLKNDPAAKTLYEEFVALRNEIRSTRRRNLPHDFQKQLFERIDRETISVSGKLVEQTTSVDFTLPVAAEPQPQWRNHESNKNLRSELLTRLKNPRVWAFPALALMIGLMFFVADFQNNEKQTVQVPPEAVSDPIEQPVPPDAPFVLLRPMSEGGDVSGNQVVQPLDYIDGKPIVEVALKLSPTARNNQYIPKLLADSGFSFVIRENGNKPVTVYEFEMPADRFLPFLTLMYLSRDEVLDYKLSDAIHPLLHRPATDDNSLHSPSASTIIVRLNVAK